MGINGRAYVIAFVGGAVAVLALSVFISVSLADAMSWFGVERGGPFAEWRGELEAEARAQLVAASAAVAALSGAAALLTVYLVRRPT